MVAIEFRQRGPAVIASSIFLLLTLVAVVPAAGQSAFPNRPIKLIVPFAPGGVTDVAARLISIEASKTLGGSIVIENRVGAGGNIGTQAAAAAPGDGYTLVLGGLTSITAILTSKDAGYDLFKDLTPVCGAITFDSVFITSKATAIGSLMALKEKIASGGWVTYGTAGANTPSHFMSAWLAHVASGKAEAVHYRGGSGLITDVLSGQLTFAAATLPVALGLRNELTVLGAMSEKRLPQMPDVPTMGEAGMPEFMDVDWRVWIAIYAPTGTPRSILDQLYSVYNAALHKSELKAALSVYAIDPMIDYTPQRLNAFQKEQFDTWKVILSKLGVVAG
jgi:tripartite-type tricarboxylate transporter receptor subunit TctC